MTGGQVVQDSGSPCVRASQVLVQAQAFQGSGCSQVHAFQSSVPLSILSGLRLFEEVKRRAAAAQPEDSMRGAWTGEWGGLPPMMYPGSSFSPS